MRRQRRRRINPFLGLFLFLVSVTFLPAACWAALASVRRLSEPQPPTLVIAYSREKQHLFEELLSGFASVERRTSTGRRMQVKAVPLPSEKMIGAAIAGEVQAVSPDSSLWLASIDEEWQRQNPGAGPLVGQSVRFAISPVVIAMRAEVARALGYPGRRLGWADIIERARTDPSFGWSHASTSTASGLLATLAQFYAGAGKTRGLTVEDVTSEAVLQYVAAVQATVKHYGEGELATVQRVLAEGDRSGLAAFVVQEQLVIYLNQHSEQKFVAIYPKEGTLWEDHPLALLELPQLDSEARETFEAFARYLRGEQAQKVVLRHGYRPADLHIPLVGEESPFTPANGVDPAQPETTLQVPSPAVVAVVRDVWWYTKKHTNVFLVVDTSGSMEGPKIEAARAALQAFLTGIRGEAERVGLVEFGSEIKRVVPLAELSRNRAALEAAVAELEVGGSTAFLDAVSYAYSALQRMRDSSRINAVVAMTDGRENASELTLRGLLAQVRDGNARGVPVYIFCIAYGSDADLKLLERIAAESGGQTYRGDETSLEDLYKAISTYF